MILLLLNAVSLLGFVLPLLVLINLTRHLMVLLEFTDLREEQVILEP